MDIERKFAIKQAWVLDDDGNEIMEIKSHSMDLILPPVVDESKFCSGCGNPTYFSGLSSWGKINIYKDTKPYKYSKSSL